VTQWAKRPHPYYHQHEKKAKNRRWTALFKATTLNWASNTNYTLSFAMKIVKLLVNDKITALCHTRKHYFKSYKEQKRTTPFPGFTPTCPYGAWEREPGNEVARKNWKSSPFLFIRASICINCVQLHLCKVLSGNYLYFTQFGGRSHVH